MKNNKKNTEKEVKKRKIASSVPDFTKSEYTKEKPTTKAKEVKPESVLTVKISHFKESRLFSFDAKNVGIAELLLIKREIDSLVEQKITAMVSASSKKHKPKCSDNKKSKVKNENTKEAKKGIRKQRTFVIKTTSNTNKVKVNAKTK